MMSINAQLKEVRQGPDNFFDFFFLFFLFDARQQFPDPLSL